MKKERRKREWATILIVFDSILVRIFKYTLSIFKNVVALEFLPMVPYCSRLSDLSEVSSLTVVYVSHFYCTSIV